MSFTDGQPLTQTEFQLEHNSDGTHKTALLTTLFLPGSDGWALLKAAGTRVSNTQMTVAGDITAYLHVGMPVKLTDTTTKYFYLTSFSYSSPNTTLNIYAGSDYVLVGNPSNIYCSPSINAVGFPDVMTWAPTVANFSAAPASAIYHFRILGHVVRLFVRMPNQGTSDNTGFTITLPLTAATLANQAWQTPGNGADNGAALTGAILVQILSGGTTAILYRDCAGAAWTGSGGKSASFQIEYEIP